MARRSTVVIVALSSFAVVIAAVFVGLYLSQSSPASYGHVLARYLKALAAGDSDAALALTSDGFVNELSDLELSPGAFRAYDFGLQGPAAPDSATLRFAVVVFDGKADAAYLADAVFRRKGLRTTLTAIRRVSKGRPLVD